MRTLNILGCGKVGKTLGRLWFECGMLAVGSVLNRSQLSSQESVTFIGAGTATVSMSDCRQADIYLIAVNDDQMASIVVELEQLALIRDGDIVFHCSGAKSSSVLASLRRKGAHVCSVHPVKSFATPGDCIRTFEGTYCAIEGDKQACVVLVELFERIGARIFPVSQDKKLLYHGATVMVCNYLTTLMEVGLQTFVEAGLDRQTAMQIMEPIVRESVGNVFEKGTCEALSGPITRGDHRLVKEQLEAIGGWNLPIGELYRLLGQFSLELVREKGRVGEEGLSNLEKVLRMDLS